MTPYQKAQELVQKFTPHARLIVDPGERVGREKHAIECAIFLVKEIFKESNSLYHQIKTELNNDDHYSVFVCSDEYWQSVYEELRGLLNNQ